MQTSNAVAVVPATYQIGVPASAQVIIVDNDRPKVQMTLIDNLADEGSIEPPIPAGPA